MADNEEKEASKRPEDSDFKQQRLPAWQPLLTPKWVILTFMIVGVVFIPIGTLIVTASNDVTEISYRYDDCIDCTNTTNPASCTCDLELEVPEDMESPVYVYYELSNYFQNHRRYVKSRSDTQLRGETGSTGSCAPLEDNSEGDIFYPCGLIANSFFNDTFKLCDGNSFADCEDEFPTRWRKDGIAWQSDIDHKFKEFSTLPADYTRVAADNVTVLPEVVDEDFIVWMRTAGLPTFRKLHRKIERSFNKGDTIRMQVENVYPVSEFDGEKRVVLSTTSWLGGKNRFLGWSYIAVAIVCILLALVFHVKNQTSPRKLGDMQYFQWAGAGASATSDAAQQ